jgi:hypothetical protein
LFHTTESLQAPFERDHNRLLKQVGESTLDYVRRHRAYNFLIDRFGRVYRIVKEEHAAQHAGHSVWADAQWLYIFLNDAFLGVSFEAKTQPGSEESPISPAQMRAGAMLTEMLRSRYDIPLTNCVTHAQVSVNSSNMRIGWHTDWAAGFPFRELNLPDNYAQPIAAVALLGFEYDEQYLRVAGARLRAGLELAEEAIRRRAATEGLSLAAWRKTLQRLYHQRLARSPHTAAGGAEPAE